MPLSNTYVPNVPQGNEQINNTQAPIEGNFQDIATLLAVNHVPFNTADTFGRHTIVEYVNQATDPSTTSTEMALYSKSINGDANGSELFYRYPSNGTIVQLTGNSNSGGSGNTSGGNFSLTPPPGAAGGGLMCYGWWQYLSGGILYLSGSINNGNISSSPFTVTFPSGFSTNGVRIPEFTQPPFNLQITAVDGQQLSTTGLTISGFVATKTTATLYFSGTISGSIINGIAVTLIGI